MCTELNIFVSSSFSGESVQQDGSCLVNLLVDAYSFRPCCRQENDVTVQKCVQDWLVEFDGNVVIDLFRLGALARASSASFLQPGQCLEVSRGG